MDAINGILTGYGWGQLPLLSRHTMPLSAKICTDIFISVVWYNNFIHIF